MSHENSVLGIDFDKKIEDLMRKYNKILSSMIKLDDCEKILYMAELDVIVKNIRSLIVVKRILEKADDEKTISLAINFVKKEIELTDAIKPILEAYDDGETTIEGEEKALEVKKIVEDAKREAIKATSSLNISLEL